ncbi:hypothetical protein NDU88_002255 [Pleurodeles waltl]|uniref:Uncharacterized protein n=1 Tax=Pleurodeles waltl TaxID=8319 RepID=A0AAV7P662_PLEWA|nr:hypothetical protein NDU88_002255 [Pleurodeles waltl]
MAAMSAVVPLAQDVAGPLAVLAAGSVVAVLMVGSLASVLAMVIVAAVLVGGSLTAVLVVGSLTAVLVAVSVAAVLVAGSLTAVLAEVSVAAVLVAGSQTAVLVKGTVSAVLVKGSVSGVLAAVQVAVPVAVLSALQVGVDVDLPFMFRPFPTLDGGAAVLPHSTFVLPEPLVAGVFAFSLWEVGNFFCFGGGGKSLPSLLRTLEALLLGALQNPAIAGTTVPRDVVVEVLGWDLERRALGEGRGGRVVGKRSKFDRKNFLDTLGRVDGEGLGVEEEVVVVGGVRLVTLGEGAWAVGCCEVDGCRVGV